MSNKETITQVFNLEEIKQKEKALKAASRDLSTVIKTKNFDDDELLEKQIYDDYTESRNNFDSIIEMGKTALEKVLEIAEEGQHPRFYEAAGIILKNLSDANREYMDIHKKMMEIKKIKFDMKKDDTPGIGVNIEKGIFVGSTADLLKQIQTPKE